MSPLRVLWRPTLALTLAVALLSCSLAGCPSAATRVAHVTLVSAGAAVASAHAEHQRAFTRATDALIRDLAADGGSVGDYDRLAAPMVAEFDARSEALVSLDAALYAAAGVTDASRQGAPREALLAAARRVLDAIERALGVLQGGNVLPPVAVPAEVRQIVAALTALVGGSDAGSQ